MDPNLFHLDAERLTEVLFAIVVLSLLVERALSILFESRFFIDRFEKKSLKELIAFAVIAAICWQWDFDALSILLVQEKTSLYGSIITGAIVAGGSKGSVKLFRDILGISSRRAKAVDLMAKTESTPVNKSATVPTP